MEQLNGDDYRAPSSVAGGAISADDPIVLHDQGKVTLLVNIVQDFDLVYERPRSCIDEVKCPGGGGRRESDYRDQIGVEVLEKSRTITKNASSRCHSPCGLYVSKTPSAF